MYKRVILNLRNTVGLSKEKWQKKSQMTIDLGGISLNPVQIRSDSRVDGRVGTASAAISPRHQSDECSTDSQWATRVTLQKDTVVILNLVPNRILFLFPALKSRNLSKRYASETSASIACSELVSGSMESLSEHDSMDAC